MHLGRLSRPGAVTATALLIGSLAVAPPAAATAAAAPAALEGRITDAATGEGVSGACVELEHSTYLTSVTAVCAGADGRYALGARLAGPVTVRTRAHAAGYVDEWGKGFRHRFGNSVTLNPGSTVVRDFALGREAGELRGTLRYPDGRPAGMVILDVHPGNVDAASVARLRTGIDGTWSLPAMAPGSYVVTSTFSFPALNSGLLTVTANATTTADLTLRNPEPRQRRLSGTVRDASSAPVGGARVTMWLPAYGEVLSAEADAAGGYAFPPVPEDYVGQHYLVARAPGFADVWSRDKPHPTSALRIYNHTAQADGWTIDFVMPPQTGSTVTGTLTDADGAPAIGVVQLRQADGALHTAVSDADGRYRFTNVRPGDVTVQYTTAGPMQYAAGQVTLGEADVYPVAAGAAVTVDNRLHGRTGTLEVRTVDRRTGALVTSACVTVAGTKVCDPSGVHRFTSLFPGTQVASIVAFPVAVDTDQPVVVRPDGVTSATVELSPMTYADFSVAKAADGTVPPVCLRLTPLTDLQPAPPGWGPYCNHNGIGDNVEASFRTTVPVGRFQVFVEPYDTSRYGRQWLGASGGTGRRAEAAVLDFRDGEGLAVPTVRLDGAGSIRGRIDTAQGYQTQRCARYAPKSVPGAEHCVRAGAEYELNGLGPYAWELRFSDGYFAQSWSGGARDRSGAAGVPVTAGQTTQYNFNLTTVGSALSLTTAVPSAMFTVYSALTGDELDQRQPVTGAGSALFNGLPTGVPVFVRRTTTAIDCWYRIPARPGSSLTREHLGGGALTLPPGFLHVDLVPGVNCSTQPPLPWNPADRLGLAGDGRAFVAAAVTDAVRTLSPQASRPTR